MFRKHPRRKTHKDVQDAVEYYENMPDCPHKSIANLDALACNIFDDVSAIHLINIEDARKYLRDVKELIKKYEESFKEVCLYGCVCDIRKICLFRNMQKFHLHLLNIISENRRQQKNPERWFEKVMKNIQNEYCITDFDYFIN